MSKNKNRVDLPYDYCGENLPAHSKMPLPVLELYEDEFVDFNPILDECVLTSPERPISPDSENSFPEMQVNGVMNISGNVDFNEEFWLTDNMNISMGNPMFQFNGDVYFENNFYYNQNFNVMESNKKNIEMVNIPEVENQPEVVNKVSEGKTSKKSKKRKRNAPNLDPLSNNCNSLSREELLHYSSVEYEQYISNLECVKPLSETDRSEIKKQRRLIKNRESAQASRQRKKKLY